MLYYEVNVASLEEANKYSPAKSLLPRMGIRGAIVLSAQYDSVSQSNDRSTLSRTRRMPWAYLIKFKEGLASKMGGGGNLSDILEQATNLINNPAAGGLGGLVEAFKSKGLGDVMSSWISTGENKSISPDQIKQALGSDKIQQIAEKAGISKDAASQQLSKLLPQIIDKLTPDGKLPEAGKVGEALNMLKNKFLSS